MASVMRHVSPRRIRSDLYYFSASDCNTLESGGGGGSPCILSVLSSLLERVVVRNARQPTSAIECVSSRKMDIFHGFRVPDISIEQYLERIFKLLITSVMLAAKFLDDLNYNNAYYAKVGGLTTKDINNLEIEFLFVVDFHLQVTVSVFESYCAHFEREVALEEGIKLRELFGSYVEWMKDPKTMILYKGCLLDAATRDPRRPCRICLEFLGNSHGT